MPLLKNISPRGEIEVPLVFRQHGSLQPGQEFEVSAEHAERLLVQPDNFEPVDAAAKRIAKRLAKDAAGEPVDTDDAESGENA